MKLSIGATGPADPDVVWNRYLRPENWREWSPQISSVRYPGSEISDGGRGRVNGLCGIGLAFEVLYVDTENRCWTWRVKPVGVDVVMTHAVLATDGGTRTTLEIDGPLPIILGYAPIARIALGRLVRR